MLAQFSIVPLDKGEGVSEWVAKVLDKIDKSGLDYRLTPMSTIVEGDSDQVFSLIKECHLLMRKHSSRVITTISIDDREGTAGRLSGKIKAVESRLGRELRKA